MVQNSKARYIKVGWIPPSPEAPLLHGGVMVDIGDEVDAPTDQEMQQIAYAAKMAFAKILRGRKKAKKPPSGKGRRVPPGPWYRPSVPSIKVMGSAVEHGAERYDDDTGQGITYCGMKITGQDIGPRDEPVDCEACRRKISEASKGS